jgi:hypothetical protein
MEAAMATRNYGRAGDDFDKLMRQRARDICCVLGIAMPGSLGRNPKGFRRVVEIMDAVDALARIEALRAAETTHE